MVPGFTPLLILCILLFLTPDALAEKKPSKKKPSRQDTGRELFKSPGKGSQPGDPATSGRGGGWAIVLEAHSGKDAAATAQSRLAQVSLDSGRNDVYLRTTERGAAIVTGNYPAADSAGAKADVASLRARKVDGKAPFAQAFLAPPPEISDPGKIPELNLESAKLTFGDRAQYTLQIAVYESKKRDDAKRAAEEAALRLRRDGELAFYYHGPQRSMVTVGVFADRDFDQSLRPRSAMLITLQERYPLNMLNGQYPIVEKRPGNPDRDQPSTLVRIP